MEESDKVRLRFKQSGHRREENKCFLYVDDLGQDSKINPCMNTWNFQKSTKMEINIKKLLLKIVQWAKQPQMALRCWTINRYRHRPSPNDHSPAKTQSAPCQHIHSAPSSFLSPLPFCSPQPCMLDASVSATPVIPLILNRLASATEEKPSVWPSPRRLLRRNPINRLHMAIGYGMDYGPRDVCGPLAARMLAWWCSGTHTLARRIDRRCSHFYSRPNRKGRGTVVSHS